MDSNEKVFSSFKAPPTPSGCALPRREVDNISVLVHRVGIETSRRCNLRCNYCYAGSGTPLPNELSFEELMLLIDQAGEVGATIIPIIGGGESMLYHHFMDLVAYIQSKNMRPGVFTNCTLVTPSIAAKLFERGAYVVGKMNSFNDRLEDKFTGVPGSSQRIKRGIRIFQDAGFASTDPSRLSLHTIITKYNYNELPAIYQWERDHNIIPYMQLPVLTGRAKAEMAISNEQASKLFYQLREIDRNVYGYDWTPMPPNVGWNCTQRLTSCYVTSVGDVQMCSGTSIVVGNIRHQSLRDILLSPTLREMRDMKKIRGGCAGCSYLEVSCCAGCTGNSFNTTGDVFTSDNRCWLQTNKVERTP